MNRRINITSEQVNKMIEMCKDSFPEYTNIQFKTKYGTHEVWFDSKPEISPDPQEFHWFELCVTELPRIILEKLMRFEREDIDLKYPDLAPMYRSGGEMLFYSTDESKHVIDLLYKEYKKLKKWESIVLMK